MYILDNLKITTSGSTGRYSATISRGNDVFEAYICVPSGFSNFLSDSLDSVLMVTLPAAMSHGEDILVRGPVSRQLLRRVSSQMQELLICNKPQLNRIQVWHEGPFFKAPDGKRYIATGCTGGVDSFATLMEHLIEEDDEDEKITHLVHNIFDRRPGPAEIERPLVEEISASLNVPLISVRSNLDKLLSPPWSKQNFTAINMHSIYNNAAAIALSNALRKFYYSSGYHYSSLCFGPHKSIALIDPELLRLMSSAGVDLESAGLTYTRVQKTEIVARSEVAQKYINVCLRKKAGRGFQNCGICTKCKRTLLALELYGALADFEESFDLQAWRRVRDDYVWHVSVSKGLFERELQMLLREKEYARSFSRMFPALTKFYVASAKDTLRPLLRR